MSERSGSGGHERHPAIAGPGSYTDLVARLSRLRAERAAEEEKVERWYAEQGTAAEQAVARSARQVRAAQDALTQVQSLVLHTEEESVRLWNVLRGRLARRRRRDPLLHAPPPTADEALDGVEPGRPGQLLHEARELLDKITEGHAPRPRRRLRTALVVLLLAVAAIVALSTALHK